MRTTTLTGVINLTEKTIALAEQVAIREQVNLVLTGYGSAGATDITVAIVYDGTLIAKKASLTDYGTYFGGVIDLNTTEAVDVFDGMPALSRVKMSFVIWDTTNECMLVNDYIWIENNPYNTGMTDPTPVEPIGGVEYAPLANGVTNGDSHTHQGGDGASLDAYYIRTTPSVSGYMFRQNADGKHLDLKDESTGNWGTLTVNNGALTWTSI